MRIIETDILIIGSGAAGLTASVYAGLSGLDVLVIDKGAVGKSGSTVGAVQIAASGRWSSEKDTQESYTNDILLSGKGLSKLPMVQALVHDIEKIIADVVEWGLRLDKDSAGNLVVSSTSGHRAPRSISANKGNSGRAIIQTLSRKAKTLSNIKLISDVITIELVCFENQVHGALAYDLAKAELLLILSKSVILATGGAGQLYPVTSNPVQATGDGFSLALKAGAALIDMEQIQFYPVSLIFPEALKGFCMSFYPMAKLYNSFNERFMHRYEPEKLEDVTRDRLAYAVACEVRQGKGSSHNGVWLDGTAASEEIKQLFPHEYKLCLEHGVDLAKDRAEIAPAAHFIMGGVDVDEDGASSVEGLYIAGETAGGLHGGNRLGNNALSECLVFGARAGKAAAHYEKTALRLSNSRLAHMIDRGQGFVKKITTLSGQHRPYQVKDRLRHIMGEYVGVLRNRTELKTAQAELEAVVQQLADVTVKGWGKPFAREVTDYIEAEHMIWTAKGIIGSSLLRRESRGAHFLSDYPDLLPTVEHTTVRFNKGELCFSTRLAANKRLVAYAKNKN
ncbi:L-aspartate oxidase [Neobacillus jeddahensis]|uniref:L-aspartate oxidase n=1 Tax=Neobacillus jeddahensis TaxID=1461580 RepID=UPI00058D3809|nr:FAD-dependent oxidoreductase [Neobacillus jeddahensis]